MGDILTAIKSAKITTIALDVSGNTSLFSNLYVKQGAAFDSSVTIKTTMDVSGMTTLSDNLSVTGHSSPKINLDCWR